MQKSRLQKGGVFEQLEAAGIYQNTIRLSIGTEHIDDIIWDLEQGFAAAAKK